MERLASVMIHAGGVLRDARFRLPFGGLAWIRKNPRARKIWEAVCAFMRGAFSSVERWIELEEQNNSKKKYFEGYLPDNEHFPQKTNKEGYHAPILFRDEDNSLAGQIFIKEIDPIEERKRVELRIAEFERERVAYENQLEQRRHENYIESVEATTQLIQNVGEMIPVLVKIGLWCRYTAYPTIKERTIPWAKKKISRLAKHKGQESNINETATEQSITEDLLFERITPEDFLKTAHDAHFKYKLNTSDAEARKHFIKIVYLASELAKEIRYFSDHTIVPDNMRLNEEQQYKWKVALEEFATEKVAESINNILQSDPFMLTEPNNISFIQAIGGTISEEKLLLPIQYADFKESFSISE